MLGTYTTRDREAARAIHKLFRRAWLEDVPGITVWFLTRPLALLIYNILIPFQVAYGLQAIITQQFDKVPEYAFSVLFLAFLYCVLWGIGGYAVIRNARAAMQYVQRIVFTNYLEKDYEFMNNTYLGALGSQATRLREALDDYDQLLFNGFCKQVIIVVSSILIIGYQSLTLALVTLISMVLVLSFTIAITKWRIKFRRMLSEASSDTAGVISDALAHGLTVKSFAAEKYETKRMNKSLKKLADVQYLSWMTSIPADLGRMILASLATFLLIIMTARLYQNQTISIAIVILVQLYVIKLVVATQDIADLIKAYESTMSSAHAAMKTMLIKPSVLDPEHPKRLPRNADYNIVLSNVTYRYKDTAKGAAAVKHFSLEVSQGEKVGLVGYSGSGKTTLTKLLLRFMDVTEGSITIDGIDIREISQHQLRTKIAYVPQEPLLFHRSITDNIAYGKPSANTAAIRDVGKKAYVDEFIKDLPKGYDTLVGERGVKLSGGQRQRVAIARALLKDAPILVLDEATSSLDSKSEQYIQKALFKLMENRTALVIAHRLSTIQKMDKIAVMNKGKIVELGTHKELLKKKNGIYAKLWAHQSGGYIGAQPETK